MLALAFSTVKKQIQIETDSKSLQYDYQHVLQLQASDEDEILRQHDIWIHFHPDIASHKLGSTIVGAASLWISSCSQHTLEFQLRII